MPVHVISEAKRCLQCKKPLCQTKGCPIKTNIPEMIRLFLDGKIYEAGDMLFKNNPLSIFCSQVCDHGAQCEGNCVQGIKGTSVHISSIEHYIMNASLDKLEITPPTQKHDQSVAVIGAGPAGLTAAINLAEKGYNVTIIEAKNYIGGMLTFGIPEFRLHKDYVKRFQKKVEQFGIKIRFNTTIGGTLHLDDLFDDGYQAVFMATGVWRPNKLGVKGESLGNVLYAVDYLQHPQIFDLGKTVFVIGAGNAAMDVARTAIRRGANTVKLLCRRDKVAASKEELEYTIADGVDVEFCTRVREITPKGAWVYHVTLDENSQVLSETEPEFWEADSIIISVSQSPKNKIVSTTHGLETTKKGLIQIIDDKGKTTRDGVWAAGDVVTGPDNVVDAVRDAKIAAADMDEYLTKLRNA